MENLYEQYGRLVLQSEIIGNQLNEVKRRIIEEINKQPKNSEVTTKKTKAE